MSSFLTNPEPHLDDSVFERYRVIPTIGRNDDFLDNDDLPDEDDLLSEVVIPEAVRLQRLLEIQEPFKQEPSDRYMSSCYLAAKTFNVPISLASLVYDKFQWFKAHLGVGDVRHTDRCWSFCAHTFIPEKPEVLYVPNAPDDARFRDNVLVHNMPNIRFYSGVPLVTQDGVRLGALCIIDKKPRVMCKHGFQFLINLAELTVRELLQEDVASKYKPAFLADPAVDSEKKLRRLPPAHVLRRLREIWFEKGLTEGVLIIDTSAPKWNVVWTNSQWDYWTTHANVTGNVYHEIWSVLQPTKGEASSLMERKIVEQTLFKGSCSFFSRVVGLDGNYSLFVSCEVTMASQPIKDVNCQILMPSNPYAGPADAEPISFDGNKLLMMFVKPVQESLESENALTSFQDEHTIPATANVPLVRALRPKGCLESDKAMSKRLDAIPRPPSAPSRPRCPNRNRAYRRPSDEQVQ